MKIKKLSSVHAPAIKNLFLNQKYMGVSHDKRYFVENFANVNYELFCQTYMSDLNNYHAFGAFENKNNVCALIGFYQSIEDPSWYWTHVRSNNSSAIKHVLDEVLAYNEENGRFKFYSLFPLKYRNSYRRLAFSENAKMRYDFFDEFYVKPRNKCNFNLPWQILFNRTLIPVDVILRCTFLKNEFREDLYHAGNI